MEVSTNLVADKGILRSAPRGFEVAKIDQNDRTEVTQRHCLLEARPALCCPSSTPWLPERVRHRFASIGYPALWMIEVPFTFNNPISDHKDLREKLQEAFDDVIDY
ncbi:hypothetical protein niasHS_011782 [Heterodera schachtii]|uniref:Uncharacterized protein n=1 Tax=Heterodera schachtii TaxID=97005 RepID=A0ABD2IAW0_HETSC